MFKPDTHNTHRDIDTNGTCLVGFVAVTYDALVHHLGEPMEGDGEKVQAEWSLRDPEQKTVATIYDWKEYRDPKLVREWHVGGNNDDPKSALDLVSRSLGLRCAVPGCRGRT